MNLPCRIRIAFALLQTLAFQLPNARAQSCQISSDLDAATLGALNSAAIRYFDMAARGDTAALRQNSIPSLSAAFSEVESAVKDHQKELTATQAAVKSVFLLEADGKAPLEHGEFYCGVFGKSGQTQNSAIFYLDNLQPGKYSVVLMEASAPNARTGFSVVLQQVGVDWKLGNLYIKSAEVAGHDSAWFAGRAREYKAKGQSHNAWCFYLQARSLMSQVPFMDTLATDMLYDEFQSAQPADVPAGGKTADLVVGGTTYKLTAMFPEAVGGDLDLIVKYQSADAANGNLAYQGNIAVMKALVAKYPEIRQAFGGFVARAQDTSGHDYGTLLAMKDIK